jgi:hypothetical protein
LPAGSLGLPQIPKAVLLGNPLIIFLLPYLG